MPFEQISDIYDADRLDSLNSKGCSKSYRAMYITQDVM